MTKKKKILICPLEWGLGHATRCVPVIEKLLENDLEVIIAADGRPLAFLENEFPHLDIIKFPGLDIEYPRKNSIALSLFARYPTFIKWLRRDQEEVDRICEKYKINAVISDNRFGCYSKNIPSVYITHQIMIKAPAALKFSEPLLYKYHRKIINNYDLCWIPDHSGENTLSGDLAHSYPVGENYSFIGPLSRFKPSKEHPEKKYKLLAIISGPEPQRSILENILKNKLQKLPYETAMVTGKTEEGQDSLKIKNLKIYSSLPSKALLKLIHESELVICRSGYSTIMDLSTIGVKAVFIPTPGQTEQEYLAAYHMKKHNYYYEKQSNFNIDRAIKESERYKPLISSSSGKQFSQAVEDLIKIID